MATKKCRSKIDRCPLVQQLRRAAMAAFQRRADEIDAMAWSLAALEEPLSIVFAVFGLHLYADMVHPTRVLIGGDLADGLRLHTWSSLDDTAPTRWLRALVSAGASIVAIEDRPSVPTVVLSLAGVLLRVDAGHADMQCLARGDLVAGIGAHA